MSTRATYRIYDNYNDLDVYFYVHHDNYPSGAALYFQEMLDYMKKEGYTNPSAEAFFRANKNAHFTKSHAAHGDTEYQYNIIRHKDKGYILQAFKIDYNWEQYNKEMELEMKRRQEAFHAGVDYQYNDDFGLQRTRKKIFEGSVEDFIKTYGDKEQELESAIHLKPVKA